MLLNFPANFQIFEIEIPNFEFQESSTKIKEPIGVVYTDNVTQSLPDSGGEASEISTDAGESEEGTYFHCF